MSVKVAKTRFMDFSLVKYHQLLGGVSNVVELGKRLISLTEAAQMMRQTDMVREYGLILSNLPVKEYQLIGQYYLGWIACCDGKSVSPSLFENIFEQSKTYKAKALITLGGLAAAKDNFEDELRYQTEALKYADLPTTIRTLQGIAVVRAKEGFHRRSLNELESILPYIRYAGLCGYYQHLNSLAVELGEMGRIEEAQNVCKIVLASPYAFAYPEWRETEQDLALRGYKSRSSVSVKQIPRNLLYLPEPSSVGDIPIRQSRARIFSLEKWKKKMVKPNGEEELDKLTEKDLVLKILHKSSQEGMTWKKLRKIIDYIDKVQSEPDE